MKRFITITTGFVFLGYLLLMIFPVTPAYFKSSYIGETTKKAKAALGFGPLFVSESASVSKSASYRLYQNGKWQQRQLLLEPLYNDYVTHGNYAALKHCRLDAYLVAELYIIRKHKGVPEMLKSSVYAEFTNHLIYRHNHNIKPDSLEVSYYNKDHATNRLNLIATFKAKP